ncbi:MAG: exodeoxyribonuclease VII small subunit [Acidimicrobiales bacterium]
MTHENKDQAGPVPVGDLSYAAAAAELDAIVRELDEGLVDVDALEVRFRRAIEIVEELDRRIRGARKNVDALMPRLAAIGEDGAPD